MRGEAREEEGTAGLKQRPEADDLVAHGAVRAQAEQPRAQYAGARGPRRVEARLVDPTEQPQAERLQHGARDLARESEHAAKGAEGGGCSVVPRPHDPRLRHTGESERVGKSRKESERVGRSRKESEGVGRSRKESEEAGGIKGTRSNHKPIPEAI